MTYRALVTEVVSLAYPSGMARNLVALRERHVRSGLVELQSKIESLQEGNDDTYDGAGNFHCGATIVTAPAGIIREVWAIRSDLPEDEESGPVDGDTNRQACQCEVPYVAREIDTIRGYSRDWERIGGRMTDSDGNINHMLPVPVGAFAVHRDQLWAYPSVNDPWKLRVIWDGIKQDYEDADPVTLSESQISLLAAFVAYKGAADDRCWDDSARLYQLYLIELKAELQREWDRRHPAVTRAPKTGTVSPTLGQCCRAPTTAYVAPDPEP